jgi:SAM-dependent methyltransferase
MPGKVAPQALPSQRTAAEFWRGYCPICESETTFTACHAWYRDHLICEACPSGSVPRERALKLVLDDVLPAWRECAVHESSPMPRGVSMVLKEQCPGYVETQFFPDIVPGQSTPWGIRCEDLERQTFADASFDCVVSLDVFEHVFDPAAATREIYRTLKPGGLHVLTTPIYKDKVKTVRCAEKRADGTVRHLVSPPEYHGNPADLGGSLVTFKYGHDLPDLIAGWAPFQVELRRFHDRHHGILGDFTDVLICRKRLEV